MGCHNTTPARKPVAQRKAPLTGDEEDIHSTQSSEGHKSGHTQHSLPPSGPELVVGEGLPRLYAPATPWEERWGAHGDLCWEDVAQDWEERWGQLRRLPADDVAVRLGDLPPRPWADEWLQLTTEACRRRRRFAPFAAVLTGAAPAVERLVEHVRQQSAAEQQVLDRVPASPKPSVRLEAARLLAERVESPHAEEAAQLLLEVVECDAARLRVVEQLLWVARALGQQLAHPQLQPLLLQTLRARYAQQDPSMVVVGDRTAGEISRWLNDTEDPLQVLWIAQQGFEILGLYVRLILDDRDWWAVRRESGTRGTCRGSPSGRSRRARSSPASRARACASS